MTTRPDVQRRHRQRREEIRRLLLDAARELLEEMPWSELSIELIAERAGLTRTAFYKYFDDRRELLLQLLEELAGRLEQIPAPWQSAEREQEPRQLLVDALGALVEIFHTHGRLLRALADEATQDGEVAERYMELGARLSGNVADRISRDVASGASVLEDSREVAAALVWMNERYLQQRFGRAPLGDPARATAALAEVWLRTVYGIAANDGESAGR
ncbi:MAG TPA: helix-turn-helix domain-containing protein [Solirubrobacteraceae bacterium]|nr:helix-turn-helix domain-containing protein [Solirubrobacteraceae bacterium]